MKKHDHDDCEFCKLREAMKAVGLSVDPNDWRDNQGFGRAVWAKLAHL